MSSEIINSFVEVKLKNKEDFLKICETLTRMGVASKTENRLYPSCYILHKQSKYYIVHFLELMMLDGNTTNYNDEDRRRRNKIIELLEQWGLLDVVHPEQIADKTEISKIKIIPYSDKKNWQIIHKYSIGKSHK